MYHNSGDLSEREGYDFKQLFAIAKVQVSRYCFVEIQSFSDPPQVRDAPSCSRLRALGIT